MYELYIIKHSTEQPIYVIVLVEQNVVLKLCGAFQEEHKILAPEETSNLAKTVRYYINRDLETELGLTVRLTDPFISLFYFISPLFNQVG